VHVPDCLKNLYKKTRIHIGKQKQKKIIKTKAAKPTEIDKNHNKNHNEIL